MKLKNIFRLVLKNYAEEKIENILEYCKSVSFLIWGYEAIDEVIAVLLYCIGTCKAEGVDYQRLQKYNRRSLVMCAMNCLCIYDNKSLYPTENEALNHIRTMLGK